ncbi:hypothetical protein [Geoalkalibacter halelectricus]
MSERTGEERKHESLEARIERTIPDPELRAKLLATCRRIRRIGGPR